MEIAVALMAVALEAAAIVLAISLAVLNGRVKVEKPAMERHNGSGSGQLAGTD